MQEIITTAFSFIIIILLTYFLKKIGMFKPEDKKFLSAILLNVNLPCVIINGFSDFTYDNSLILAIFLCLGISVVSIFSGYIISKNKPKEVTALYMMTSSGYNIGIFTIPFVSSFLSSTAVVCALMFDVGNAIWVFGTAAAITSAVVNKNKSNPIPAILKKLFTTVPFLSYIFMMFILLLNIQLPDIVFAVTDLGANSTSFLAMVLIGIMIEFNIDKTELREVLSVIGLRYSISILGCVLIFFLPMFDIELKKALMIAALSPLSTSSIVFSQKLGCKASSVGAVSSLSIIFSIIAIICVLVFV